MSRNADAKLDDRVLVFAPVGRDAELTRTLLERAAIPCGLYESVSALVQALATEGAAALLLTEEALDSEDITDLAIALEEQPPWSDLPVLLFAGGPGVEMSMRTVR